MIWHVECLAMAWSYLQRHAMFDSYCHNSSLKVLSCGESLVWTGLYITYIHSIMSDCYEEKTWTCYTSDKNICSPSIFTFPTHFQYGVYSLNIFTSLTFSNTCLSFPTWNNIKTLSHFFSNLISMLISYLCASMW